MTTNIQMQLNLLPSSVRKLFDEVDTTESKEQVTGELAFPDKTKEYRRQVRVLCQSLVDMASRGASEAELQFTAVATLAKIKGLKDEFFVQRQFYQTKQMATEARADGLTGRLQEMTLQEGFPGFRVSTADCQEGLGALKIGSAVVHAAGQVMDWAIDGAGIIVNGACSIHPDIQQGCDEIRDTTVATVQDLVNKSGFSDFLKRHREQSAVREEVALSAMREMCGSEMSDEMIHQAWNDAETVAFGALGYGVGNVGGKAVQRLKSMGNKLPPAATVYSPKTGLASFMQGAPQKSSILEGVSYKVLQDSALSGYRPFPCYPIAKVKPLALAITDFTVSTTQPATVASYSPRMAEVVGKIQNIIQEVGNLEENAFTTLRRHSSIFEKFLPTYPSASSPRAMERIWISAIEEHTFPFTTQQYKAEYFKGWDQKTVVKLDIGDRSYVVKTSAVDPGIVTEVEGLSALRDLGLKYLRTPNIALLATTISPKEGSKLFMAKDWVDGSTFSRTMEALGQYEADTVKGFRLFQDFKEAHYAAGKATGELHRKTAVKDMHNGARAMEALTESLESLMTHANTTFTRLMLPVIDIKKVQPLIEKVKKTEVPTSYGFYDIHGEQFVWKKIEDRVGNPNYEFWLIDAEHCPVTFTSKRQPLSTPSLELSNFLFSIEETGQAMGVASDKVTLLKDAFLKGYVSEYTAATPQSIQELLEIRSELRSIRDLAIPYTPIGKSTPAVIHEDLRESIDKLNQRLKDLIK